MGNEEADKQREEHLRALGIRVIRFWNTALADNSEGVLDAVYVACLEGARNNSLVQHKLNADGRFDPNCG